MLQALAQHYTDCTLQTHAALFVVQRIIIEQGRNLKATPEEWSSSLKLTSQRVHNSYALRKLFRVFSVEFSSDDEVTYVCPNLRHLISPLGLKLSCSGHFRIYCIYRLQPNFGCLHFFIFFLCGELPIQCLQLQRCDDADV